MITALLVLHLLVTLTLIATVLVQRSEGGGLGIGSSQGMGSFMSGRGTANLLTRTTAILAAVFMALSLALAVMNRGSSGRSQNILGLPAVAPSSTLPVPGSTLPATPPIAPPGSTATPATTIPNAAPRTAPNSAVPATVPAPSPVPAPPAPGH